MSAGAQRAGRRTAGPRVCLHVGMNKTGTSAIQQYLTEHADALRRVGALYPETGREGAAHYGLSRALGFRHSRHARSPQEPEALARGLEREIRASGPRTVILSSEDFVLSGDVAAVRQFLAAYDVDVVVYLRRHDHWWLSVYNQAVRMVARPPWESGLQGYLRHCRTRRNPPGRYRALVERWAGVFGEASIVLRPYESLQNPGGVVADFLRAVGLETLAEDAARSDRRANTSVGYEALHLVDLLQRADIDPALRNRLVRAALEDDRGGDSQPVLMRPRLGKRLIDENRADYEYLARTFLGRADGVLFLEPEPDPDADWSAPELPDRVHVVARLVELCARAD